MSSQPRTVGVTFVTARIFARITPKSRAALKRHDASCWAVHSTAPYDFDTTCHLLLVLLLLSTPIVPVLCSSDCWPRGVGVPAEEAGLLPPPPPGLAAPPP